MNGADSSPGLRRWVRRGDLRKTQIVFDGVALWPCGLHLSPLWLHPADVGQFDELIQSALVGGGNLDVVALFRHEPHLDTPGVHR